MTYGPGIIARTLSVPSVADRHGRLWQYHSRSDRHSKVACWAVLFDLLSASSLMRQHAAAGKVAFGINRQLNDWTTNRKKNLDLVVARTTGDPADRASVDLGELATRFGIVLTPQEQAKIDELPTSHAGSAGSTVLVALEAKACMTAHIKALPRLHDELTSSYQTIHGDSQHALAVGLAVINHADTFISPDLNKDPEREVVVSPHSQPNATQRTIAKIEEIHRRPGGNSAHPGFDALGIIVVDARNDGSPVTLVNSPPAPQPSSPFHYDKMIQRAAQSYDASFVNV